MIPSEINSAPKDPRQLPTCWQLTTIGMLPSLLEMAALGESGRYYYLQELAVRDPERSLKCPDA